MYAEIHSRVRKCYVNKTYSQVDPWLGTVRPELGFVVVPESPSGLGKGTHSCVPDIAVSLFLAALVAAEDPTGTDKSVHFPKPASRYQL